MAEGRNPAEISEDVRRLLDGIVKRHPDVQDIAAEIVVMLDGLVGSRGTRLVQRRTGTGVKYRIEMVNKRAMLYEVRPLGAPLRVSHELYTSLVRVLAATDTPLYYDEIAEGVEEATAAKLAEWQGRLLLRFLQRADPSIVVRERSRYRVVDTERFPAAAQRLWRATERARE